MRTRYYFLIRSSPIVTQHRGLLFPKCDVVVELIQHERSFTSSLDRTSLLDRVTIPTMFEWNARTVFYSGSLVDGLMPGNTVELRCGQAIVDSTLVYAVIPPYHLLHSSLPWLVPTEITLSGMGDFTWSEDYVPIGESDARQYFPLTSHRYEDMVEHWRRHEWELLQPVNYRR